MNFEASPILGVAKSTPPTGVGSEFAEAAIRDYISGLMTQFENQCLVP